MTVPTPSPSASSGSFSNPESRQGQTARRAAPAPEPKLVPCKNCGSGVTALDKYCRHCGKRIDSGPPWYHQPIAIIILTLTVLGPFALPLVWKSSLMTPRQKWVLGIAISVFSVVLLVILGGTVRAVLEQYSELSHELNSF